VDVAQDAVDDFGGAELGTEDAADKVLRGGRELAVVDRGAAEQSGTGRFGPAG
jgi:hypothetical protein